MSKDSKTIAPEIAAVTKRPALWMDPLLGLLAGFVGGLLCKAALGSWTMRYLVLASLFGLLFGLFFSKRATSRSRPHLESWFCIFPVDRGPRRSRPFAFRCRHVESMFGDAQEHFPELVAYLVCLGMPVEFFGVFPAPSAARRTSRRLVGGEPLLLAASQVCSAERYSGAGCLREIFSVAWWIGSDSFTRHDGRTAFRDCHLDRRNVRAALSAGCSGFGSSMGWGLGYGIFWWFFGPLTMLPLVTGAALDWSSGRGTALFGSLVGHILYGLIVGVAYATVDRVWVRLFIQSDPLNREPEGPGLRLFRSLRWGTLQA